MDRRACLLAVCGAVSGALGGAVAQTLYTLFDTETSGEHLLSLEADAPGLALFSATFG